MLSGPCLILFPPIDFSGGEEAWLLASIPSFENSFVDDEQKATLGNKQYILSYMCAMPWSHSTYPWLYADGKNANLAHFKSSMTKHY